MIPPLSHLLLLTVPWASPGVPCPSCPPPALAGAPPPAGAPPAAGVQDPDPDPGPGPKPVERLEEWPPLEHRERIEKDVQRLRKASTEAMGEQAREALVADGAQVAPLLIQALEKERDEDARERILEVLEAVVGAPHTRLLVPSFTNRKLHVRLWALHRAAAYPDPGLLPAALEVWKKLEKRERRKKGSVEEVERFAVALCLTSSGDLSGLDVLLQGARRSWKKHKLELRVVMEAVRGDEATDRLLEHLGSGERKDESAALRLLAGCGTKKATGRVRAYLQKTDNTLRVDAINALRGIIDGAQPLERLPVFEAIELAKEWLERVH